MGFTKPTESPRPLVRSYRTVSPLPRASPRRGEAVRRSTLCCTFPSLTAGRRYRPSCPAEPGLSSSRRRATASGHPTHSRPSLKIADRDRPDNPPDPQAVKQRLLRRRRPRQGHRIPMQATSPDRPLRSNGQANHPARGPPPRHRAVTKVCITNCPRLPTRLPDAATASPWLLVAAYENCG